jgi:hypothetical protein
LQAGSICLAGSWRLEDKIGLPLAAIHTTADVPHCMPMLPFSVGRGFNALIDKQKLEMSMDRYFEKMKTDKLVLRNNYSIQVRHDLDPDCLDAWHAVDPEELAWAYSSLGDEGR